jgi:PAS domain S-box-containing protein
MNDSKKELEDSLAFALQSGKMGTWNIDLEKDTVQCSAEMLELWGLKESEFSGDRSTLQKRVHPDDLPVMVAAINQAIATRTTYELEYRIFPFNGEMKWVLSRGRHTFSSHSENPVRFAGIIYDITEKKEKEKALAQAEKSRDQFFMIASHELRTPLACLSLQMEVLEWIIKNEHTGVLADDRIESGFNKQKEHINRISRIVDNILFEARNTQGAISLRATNFDVSEMMSSLISEFSLVANSAGVSLELVHEESVTGKWDRFRLEQVILNLFMNALKYGNKKPIEVEVRKSTAAAVIVVRDQGIGINLEDQKRIFERFERAMPGNNIHGLGLGLYIAKSIIHLHHGQITVKSSPGEGSEFTVTLPCNIP